MNDFDRLYHHLKSLSDLDQDDITNLKDLFIKEKFPAKSFIFKEGEHYTKVSFILSGLVKKFYLTHDGKEFIKDFAATGEIIAPYSSLLQKKMASFSIQTLETTELLTIEYSKIETLFAKDIKWMKLGKIISDIHFINRERREEEFLKFSAKERYEIFKIQYPHLLSKLKKQDIASYLGITPVSLSRLNA